MSGGRLTDYTPDLLDKAYEYLERWYELGHEVPSHAGFAIYIGISRSYLYTWAKDPDKEEFSNILSYIMDLQQLELIKKGLNGTFNSNITKLMLGKHGFHERQEISGPEGKPVRLIATDMTADQASKIYDDIIN